jgi:hypothetical protein
VLIWEDGRELAPSQIPSRVALETGQPQSNLLIGIKREGTGALAIRECPAGGQSSRAARRAWS